MFVRRLAVVYFLALKVCFAVGLPPDPDFLNWTNQFLKDYAGVEFESDASSRLETGLPMYKYHGANHDFYLKKATQGHPDVMLLLANNFLFGRGTSVSTTKAEYWYREAALLQHAYAQLATAILILQTHPKGESHSDLRQFLSLSAAQGIQQAQILLRHIEGKTTIISKVIPDGGNDAFNRAQKILRTHPSRTQEALQPLFHAPGRGQIGRAHV